MGRILIIFALAAAGLSAAVNVYLTDGTYQRAREYQVLGDRVRYYSVERSDWEELPLALVDLKKTKAEEEADKSSRKAEVDALDSEEKAEREYRREIARVPQEAGVYWIESEQKLTPLKLAEGKIVKDKKRSILKVLSPIPIVAGKSTLELDGETAVFIVTGDRPEFYFRLDQLERIALVELAPKKGSRLVETWNKMPVSNELVQEHKEVEIFRRQVSDGLYRVWPQKVLPPGEYALIQFTEGEGNTRVWDFKLAGPAKK